VSQYAREEAKKKSNGLQWYNAQVASNEVLKFFKDMRDWNIHVEPVRPSRHIAVIVNERIRISEPVRVLMQKEDGATEVLEQKEEPSKPNVQETSGEVRIRYVLMDWGGSEDAVSLSHQYLAALENFVKAGLSNGVISG
jgi:hypothetical protein